MFPGEAALEGVIAYRAPLYLIHGPFSSDLVVPKKIAGRVQEPLRLGGKMRIFFYSKWAATAVAIVPDRAALQVRARAELRIQEAAAPG